MTSKADAPAVVGRRPRDLAAEATRPPPPQAGPAAWPAGFAATAADRSALLVLLGLAALTPRRLLELAAREGTARNCLAAVRAGRAGSEGDRKVAASTDPADVLERVRSCGARLVAVGDPGYPSSLLDLYDPPAGLLVRGEGLVPDRLRVSIVGARNCSATGRDVSEALAEALGRRDVEVVSGAARGIDAAAHRGALRSGGTTVAVLGCGIDVAYPSQHRRLLGDVERSGTIVGEYPPGIPAEPFRFPARNRIVAAMSRAVVVVEGAEGSGSMITADHALEIGRDVFAVPGPLTSPLSVVPLALIREGAILIRGSQDLLEDLGLEPLEAPGTDPGAELEPSVRAVWDALSGPALADDVARRCRLPVARVIPLLVSLEVRGLVRQVGGRYERRPTV